jgi:hypothetical protein
MKFGGQRGVACSTVLHVVTAMGFALVKAHGVDAAGVVFGWRWWLTAVNY